MEKPNILWLVADHFAFAHHTSHYRLATYERLGAEGITFAQAVSVCSQCQPARASMLKGVYPHRHGMLVNDGASGTRHDFEPDQQLFSHHLAKAGYANAYFGKWHCGVKRTAQDYGFEGWSLPGYGSPYRSPEYAGYVEELGLPDPQVQIDWDLGFPDRVGRVYDLRKQGFGPFVAAGRLISSPENHEAYFVAHLASQWLRHAAATSQPFCLRVDVWGPHHPYHSAGEFVDACYPEDIPVHPNFHQTFEGLPLTYEACRRRWNSQETRRPWSFWQRALARCYEQVMLVDDAFGRVVATLDNLGLRENTLVIMTADHGDLIASHGDLFNKDCLMVEETTRIPMALRWPGTIRPGISSNSLVSNMDLVPTILEAAGAPMPPTMDCESLLGLCRAPQNDGREDIMCQHHGGFRMEFFQRLLRWGDFKYVAHLDDYDELYDLAADPYELRNLAPDTAHRSDLAQMRDRLRDRMARHGDDSRDSKRLLSQLGGSRIF